MFQLSGHAQGLALVPNPPRQPKKLLPPCPPNSCCIIGHALKSFTSFPPPAIFTRCSCFSPTSHSLHIPAFDLLICTIFRGVETRTHRLYISYSYIALVARQAQPLSFDNNCNKCCLSNVGEGFPLTIQASLSTRCLIKNGFPKRVSNNFPT